MAFSLVAKPTFGSAPDGVYTEYPEDGAVTEPPTDGAFADTGDGWVPVYTLFSYPFWTLGSKSVDSSIDLGAMAELGELGVLIEEGEVGIPSSASVWTRIEVPA